MSDLSAHQGTVVAESTAESRGRFIIRTYSHLLFAILAFTAFEVVLFQSGYAARIAEAMLSVNWMWILGGFMVVGWLATRFAHQSSSMGVQYLALVGFVIAEGLIFVPLLFVANYYAPGAIQTAAGITIAGFLGLTGVVWYTRKDFSFLRTVLMWGGLVALIAIAAGALFGFGLGTWFSVGMVAFAGAAVLYDTSNVLHHYPEDRYVGASLQLFASVALMFWYVLRLVMDRR